MMENNLYTGMMEKNSTKITILKCKNYHGDCHHSQHHDDCHHSQISLYTQYQSVKNSLKWCSFLQYCDCFNRSTSN